MPQNATILSFPARNAAAAVVAAPSRPGIGEINDAVLRHLGHRRPRTSRVEIRANRDALGMRWHWKCRMELGWTLTGVVGPDSRGDVTVWQGRAYGPLHHEVPMYAPTKDISAAIRAYLKRIQKVGTAGELKGLKFSVQVWHHAAIHINVIGLTDEQLYLPDRHGNRESTTLAREVRATVETAGDMFNHQRADSNDRRYSLSVTLVDDKGRARLQQEKDGRAARKTQVKR